MGILGKISRSIKDPKKAIVRNVNRVDDYTGKKVFGNTVGFKRNFVGSRSISKLDETLKESNPKAYNLAKNQFLFLDKIYDDSIISKIKSKYDQLMENEQTSVIVVQHKGQVFSRQIKTPMQALPELEELLIKDVTDIIKGYYGKNFQIKEVVGYRNYHVPSEISSKHATFSDRWHCDRRNTSEMKLFVCLSNVTESDGPFHVQSMERTKYLMDAGFGTREDYSVPKEILDDPEHIKKAIGQSGSAYFGNANLCLHKAGIPAEGHQRDLIAFVFIPSNEPLKDDWKDHVKYSYGEDMLDHTINETTNN